MTEGKVRYQKFGGGKLGPGCYQLVEDYQEHTGCIPDKDVSLPFVELSKDGLLTIKAGFASDGASGQVIEDNSVLRAAFAHDAKYRLIREGLLAEYCKAIADDEFRKTLLEDGCLHERALLFYEAVHLFGHSSIEGGNPILECP